VLGPHAKARGWAPGPIKDAQTGAAGWLLWVSLGLLLGDCFSELGLLLLQTAVDKARKYGWIQRVGLNSGSKLSGGFSRGSRRGSGNSKDNSWQAAAGDYAQLRVADSEQGLAVGGLGLNSNLNRSNNSNAAASHSHVEMSPTGSASGLLDDGNAVDGPSNAYDGVSNASWRTDQQQQQQRLGSSVSWAAGSSNAAYGNAEPNRNDNDDDDAGSSRDIGGWMLSAKFWLPGLLLSTALCSGILGPLLPLGMPLHEPLIAVSAIVLCHRLAMLLCVWQMLLS
jgi:hypothetical protein